MPSAARNRRPAEALPQRTQVFHRMPQAPEAERAVLGGCIFDDSGQALSKTEGLVDPVDFSAGPNFSIFTALCRLRDAGAKPDLITVQDQLLADGSMHLLGAVGGLAYLAQLTNEVASVENIEHHCRIVRDAANRRRLILQLDSAYSRALNPECELSANLDQTQQDVLEICNRHVGATTQVTNVKPVLHTMLTRLVSRYANKQAVTGVATGYERFDEMTAGLQPGDLIIIAARPSMGKTALVCNFSTNSALSEKPVPNLIFSLEMSKESLVERMVCSEARVNSQRVRTGFLDSRDFIKIKQAAELIMNAPLYFDDMASPTLAEIASKTRRWRADTRLFPNGLDDPALMVLDYLQLVLGTSSDPNQREKEISAISRGLKALAKQTRMPIIALSQLNRDCEKRADKRPQLSDLRESGALEQDADLIAFLYRDAVYNKDTDEPNVAELIIGKQRNGPTGIVRLHFEKECTKFLPLREA